MNAVDRRQALEADRQWEHPAALAAGWLCLGAVLLWISLRIYPALYLPWWFNTDEVVSFYEVIRQLRLEPAQTFFDIPGTPYITLTSVLTAIWWAVERVFGMIGTASPSDFAFANVQGVFTLMRALTMAMYLFAVGLAFDLFRRAAGALTAIVASLLMATLPIHVQYSYFARTESLGLVLCLSAVWIVLYSSRRGTPGAYVLAGVLSGVAMGARYHFALVGLPVLLAIYFLRDREQPAPGQSAAGYRSLYAAAGTLAVLFVGGSVMTVLFKANVVGRSWLTDTMMLTTGAGPGQYATAKQTIAYLWMMCGIGSAVLLLCHRVAHRTGFCRSLVNPFTLLLVIGFIAGFLLSHPTFLWRGEYQLKSIQFYADWTDPLLVSVGPIRSWWDVSLYYFREALPERWLQAAFFAGTAIVLWRRQATQLAFLIGAALCFLAHPLTMKRWPHHIIPWLPLLCFVAAVPAGMVGAWLTRRNRRVSITAALLVLFASVLVWATVVRLRQADNYLVISKSRTQDVTEMTAWLSRNVPSGTYVLLSYYALNEDGFLKWIESAGVPVPKSIKQNRNVAIWWLDRNSIDGRAGVLCVSRADIVFFHEDFERRSPGSTYNPFEDARFEPLARFGGGFYELQVFRFDFRHRGGA